MNDLCDGYLQDVSLAFLGEIVAVQSHEVTNAFSVINELAGLQLDIVRDTAKGQPLDPLELESISEKIRQHVRRGEATIRSINWIAHRVDNTSAILDINDTLSKIIAIAKHRTRLRTVRFVLELPEESARLKAHPFFFTFAVFLGIDAVSQVSSGNQMISLGYLAVEGGLEFTISTGRNEALVTGDEEENTTLKSLIGVLGGELRWLGRKGSTNTVSFFVPGSYQRDGHDPIATKESL
jgi:hypothetical protein